MAALAADRNLLFALLALHNGLIDRERLLLAFQNWSHDKNQPFGSHLVSRGDLGADDQLAIEALVELSLKRHGGNAERSLGTISVDRTMREALARVAETIADGSVNKLGFPLDATRADLGSEPGLRNLVGPALSNGQRYRVLRPHAQGGLGAVYVALDTELDREVALKQILDRHADDPVSRQRFMLEAQVTGGLEHPGIVPVYGLGADTDGRPYYAMRFIRGDSLKEAIDRFHGNEALKSDPGRRSLELRQLLRRFTDVCNAIEYAHSRGVLHRDIKPSNVIVGNHGETLVVDWGLAKPLGRAEPGVPSGEPLLGRSPAGGSADTLPGSTLGTPGYMSPESAAGGSATLGPRSDVYSLGATLYYVLTGKAPIEGNNLARCSPQCRKAISRTRASSTPRSTSHWKPFASKRWRSSLRIAMTAPGPGR